jgi:hypothetical protein
VTVLKKVVRLLKAAEDEKQVAAAVVVGLGL